MPSRRRTSPRVPGAVKRDLGEAGRRRLVEAAATVADSGVRRRRVEHEVIPVGVRLRVALRLAGTVGFQRRDRHRGLEQARDRRLWSREHRLVPTYARAPQLSSFRRRGRRRTMRAERPRRSPVVRSNHARQVSPHGRGTGSRRVCGAFRPGREGGQRSNIPTDSPHSRRRAARGMRREPWDRPGAERLTVARPRRRPPRCRRGSPAGGAWAHGPVDDVRGRAS
jgi:hypothetical protein